MLGPVDLAQGARVAVVTGASRGLGLEIARSLCSQGMRVALCSRSSSEIRTVVESLAEEFGPLVWGASADVSSSEDALRFSERVAREVGRADILINNAAILGPVGLLSSLQLNRWSDAIDINVKGVLFMTAAFSSQLLGSEAGRVINISGAGVGGPRPMERTSAYVTSKYAVAGLTEALGKEFGPHGVTVNAIAPGSLHTSFLRGVLEAGPEVAGIDLFDDAASRERPADDSSLQQFLVLLNYVLSSRAGHLNGRLLSARWNSPEQLGMVEPEQMKEDMYKLRRIDQDLFRMDLL